MTTNNNSSKKRVNKKDFRSRANDYSLEELTLFARATYKAYLSVISTRPNAIIAPLRGAEPIVKIMNFYANEEKKSNQMPRIFYPKVGQISLGQHGKIVDKTLPGFLQSQSEPEQVRELRRIFDSVLKKSSQKDKRIHVVVVDEVRHGGSAAQVIEMLEGLIAKKKLKKPVSISLISIAEKNAYRSTSYSALKSRIHVKEFLVPRVFTMDSGNNLFPLFKYKNKVWPFNTLLKLGITKKAVRGRHELLSDISALKLFYSKNRSNNFGFAKACSRINKIKRVSKR